MKILLDKKVITLEEVAQAEQLRKDYQQVLDNNMLEILARKASGTNGNLVKIESVEVTKNHYQLTIFAKVILETYDSFIKTYFDVLQADIEQDRNEIDNHTLIYKLV